MVDSMSSLLSTTLTQPQIIQLLGKAARQIYWPAVTSWREALTFSQTRKIDGSLPPVIIIDDPVLAAQRGVARPEIPGAVVVSVNDLDAAVRALNDAIQLVRRQRTAH